MPVSSTLSPIVKAQLASQIGMGRSGGMMSKGSSGGPTGTFTAMENALLKKGAKSPKQMAAGQPGRQFFTKSAGGDMSGLKKIKGGLTPSKGPKMSQSQPFAKFKS